MLDRDSLPQIATFAGSLTSCGSVPAYMISESAVLLTTAALGAFISIGGLIYTVINGERNYRLAREQLRLAQVEQLQRLRLDRQPHWENDDGDWEGKQPVAESDLRA